MNDRERALQAPLHELLLRDSRDGAAGIEGGGVLDATFGAVGGTTRVADGQTFEEAGVQTPASSGALAGRRVAGLLVRMQDGTAYEIAIVQSGAAQRPRAGDADR